MSSRYVGSAVLSRSEADGREVQFLRTRFLPPTGSLPTLQEKKVDPAVRLDRIATNVYGAPDLWWRICDASDAMNPFDLETETGRQLRVPMPGAEDR